MRLLLAGDNQRALRDLRMSLSPFKWIELSGETQDGHDAVAKAVELQPDVMVIATGSDSDHGQTIREIRSASPSTEIVILSEKDDAQAKKQALEAGAAVYIPASAVWTTLMPALRELERGISASRSKLKKGASN